MMIVDSGLLFLATLYTYILWVCPRSKSDLKFLNNWFRITLRYLIHGYASKKCCVGHCPAVEVVVLELLDPSSSLQHLVHR